MDGWKYIAKSGLKESGFENSETRFQDCNLSRKQESRFSGWHENGLSVKCESKFSAKKANFLCGNIESKKTSRNESKKENKAEVFPAFLLATWNERKLSIHLYGWQPIIIYYNKELLQ